MSSLGVGLSLRARQLVVNAFATLPDDFANPVPLCERVACVLDALAPLVEHEGLTDEDRRILVALCSDRSLLLITGVVHAMDAFRALRHSRRRALMEAP